MSHISEGFAITDIQAVASVLETDYPNLELAQGNKFRTYGTEYGQFSSDIPGFYQLKILLAADEAGVDIRSVAERIGVALPESLENIEYQRLSGKDERDLFGSDEIRPHRDHVVKNVISQDAEYVIRFRDSHANSKRAYEIGLVRHPLRDEYVALTDTFSNGLGMFSAEGIGEIDSESELWGLAFRQSYAVQAARNVFEQESSAGNLLYGSFSTEKLPDGSIKILIEGI